MALSKEAGDEDSWQVVDHVWNAGGRFALRMAEPCRELGEDLTEGINYHVNNVRETALAIASSPTTRAIMRMIKQRPLIKALGELSEDSGGLWLPALVYALCPMAAAPKLLTLAGIPGSLKFTYGACAGLSIYGIHKFYCQKTGLSPSSMAVFHGAMGAMLLSGAVHLALAQGGLPMLAAKIGLPAEVLTKIVTPEVFLYSLGNMICYPVMLLNLGYISGARPSQMVPAILLNTMGNTAMLVSCMDYASYEPLLATCIAMGCFFGSTCTMNGLVEGAAQLSFANRNRVEHTIDATVFFWSLLPMFQTFTITGSIGPEQSRVIMALADIPAKLGVLHIMLKSRPAIEAAAHHFDEAQ